MVEDGVSYEFYGNYAELFRGWLIAYALLILLPVFVFGRKRLVHLSIPKQISIGLPTIAVLSALPFALAAESYFAYQEFMRLCRTEVALKVYEPMPEYVEGYAIDLGDDVSLSELASCGRQCQRALLDHGYDFFEQISAKNPIPEDRRAVIGHRSDGYYYIQHLDEPILRVYRFYLTPVGEGSCTEDRGQLSHWVPPGLPRRFCIDHEISDEIRSDREFDSDSFSFIDCCVLQLKYRSTSLLSGEHLAEAGFYKFFLPNYLSSFSAISWGRAVARFDRCGPYHKPPRHLRVAGGIPLVVGHPRVRHYD